MSGNTKSGTTKSIEVEIEMEKRGWKQTQGGGMPVPGAQENKTKKNTLKV